MKKALLASVAAIALIGGASMASAQLRDDAGGGSPKGSPPTANQPGSPGSSSKDSDQPGKQQRDRGAQERTGPQKSQKSAQERQEQPGQPGMQQKQRSTQEQQDRPGTSDRQKSTQDRQQRQDQPGMQQRQQTQSPTQQRQTESPQQPGGRQGTVQGQRPMTQSNVSLTTEQKTTIRNTVINTAPKVTNVDFDVKVGVVVPRTVRVAPVPRTIVDIQPEWRGFMYFVYADEIIIVEPRTLRIVAVLEV
jgi:hypothetical protein